MKQRILTGLALVSLLILLFFTKNLTPYVFDLFIVLLAMYGGVEIANLLRRIGFYNSKWCIVLYPIISYGLYKLCILKKVELYLIVVMQIALVIIISAGVSVFYGVAKRVADNEVKTRKLKYSNEQFAIFKGIQTLFGLIYPGFVIMLLFIVNNIQNMKYIFAKFDGMEYVLSLFLLLYTFAVPIMVDTFAMLTGTIFGGPKLCAKISPSKTVSGAIGGLIFGSLSAVALFIICNLFEPLSSLFTTLSITWWKLLILGIVSSIFCQLGDIFESFIKRKAGVKDSGDILPGHGGILDRFDSHIANIIIVFIFLLLI